MKYVVFISFILLSCSKEVALPISADFEVVTDQNDFTIPAKVSLSNTTVGAENYLWTFEGGEPSTSDKKNPGVIVYRNAGIYTIKLQADNFDGIKQVIEKQIVINSKINVDFTYNIEGDTFSPVIVSFKNSSSGSDKFEWVFEGGNPSLSTQENPKVTFENGGDHKVSLKVFNQQVSITKDSTISFQPELTPNFDIEIPKQYEELEAPSEIVLKNSSIGNTTNNWIATGADNPNSIEKEPTMRFSKAGTYNIRLETGNGKKTKSVTKEIVIKPNKGFSYIKDVKLGIYSPQNSSAVYYSTFLRKSFTESGSLSKSEAESIDLVYFGLNQSFGFNQFISPDEAQKVGIKAIFGATKTVLINSQSDISPSVFDKIDATFLTTLQIDKISEIDNYFTDSLPVLILFENSQKKKGALLVKSFVKNGLNSQIVFDLKVVK
ncbi:MAG: PKD repeat protein [Spirosomataceae bacterium]|jgi:PKD repeat protein